VNIRIDPENSETQALSQFAGKFARKRVLEVGCGDGRVTRLFAPFATSVHAIDSDADDIAQAIEKLPVELHEVVHFEAASLEAFSTETLFDAVLLSWSL
jgi:2-polyprenyl-3-methyl-5-hydroxy-6-metoxy-1,4-benzoquinol methylase